MELIGFILLLVVVGLLVYTQKPEWVKKILGFFKKSK